MVNAVRNQTVWLPTGNPDTTNISPADFIGLGGRPGELGVKFNYNDRVYQRVQLDSGAVAGSGAGIPAVNMLTFWKDKTKYLVTVDRRQAIGGSATASYANFVAGVLRNAATAGNYVDILKKGRNISLLDGGNSFLVGQMIFAELDSVAAVDRVAVGANVVYERLGIALGAASGGLVSCDVEIDIEHQ